MFQTLLLKVKVKNSYYLFNRVISITELTVITILPAVLHSQEGEPLHQPVLK